MDSEQVERTLRLVRHQLDMLDTSRMLAGLNEEEEANYRELCRVERDLLSKVKVVA